MVIVYGVALEGDALATECVQLSVFSFPFFSLVIVIHEIFF